MGKNIISQRFAILFTRFFFSTTSSALFTCLNRCFLFPLQSGDHKAATWSLLPWAENGAKNSSWEANFSIPEKSPMYCFNKFSEEGGGALGYAVGDWKRISLMDEWLTMFFPGHAMNIKSKRASFAEWPSREFCFAREILSKSAKCAYLFTIPIFSSQH